MSRSQCFFNVHVNATIPLTSTFGNEYLFPNVLVKGIVVRGDCIACDALFHDTHLLLIIYCKKRARGKMNYPNNTFHLREKKQRAFFWNDSLSKFLT